MSQPGSFYVKRSGRHIAYACFPQVNAEKRGHRYTESFMFMQFDVGVPIAYAPRMSNSTVNETLLTANTASRYLFFLPNKNNAACHLGTPLRHYSLESPVSHFV